MHRIVETDQPAAQLQQSSIKRIRSKPPSNLSKSSGATTQPPKSKLLKEKDPSDHMDEDSPDEDFKMNDTLNSDSSANPTDPLTAFAEDLSEAFSKLKIPNQFVEHGIWLSIDDAFDQDKRFAIAHSEGR